MKRLLAAALAALLLASCGARRMETRDPNVVIIGWIAGPAGLNPLVSVSSASTMIEDEIFAPLVDLDAKMLPRWSSSLAKSVDISPDGKTYVIHLRPAKWSDGAPLDAADVVFSLELYANPHMFSPDASDFSLMTSARAVDAHTVEVRLSHPSPPFLPNALGEILPLPRHVLGKYPPSSVKEATYVNTDAEFSQHPIVSGPYRIAVNVSQSYVTLERNPEYWGTPAILPKIVFRVYPQQDSLYAAVDAGEVDVTNIPPNLWHVHGRLRGNYKFLTWPWNVAFTLLPNFANKDIPFIHERAVRQAMMYAINRKFIIDGIMNGQADMLNGPLPSFSPYYNPNVAKYSYDPAKARAILEKAGWLMHDGVRMKNGVALRFTLKTGGATDEIATDISELVQADMRAVGIDCRIQNEELQTFFNDVHNTNFEVALRGKILGAYPDDYLSYDSSQTRANGGNNVGSYKNPVVDHWIEAARTAPNPKQARYDLNQYQAVAAEDLPSLWLYSNRLAAVVPDDMTGFGLTPLAPAAVPMDLQFWRRIQPSPSARSRQ